MPVGMPIRSTRDGVAALAAGFRKKCPVSVI